MQHKLGKRAVSLTLAAVTKHGPCHAIVALLTRVQDETGPVETKKKKIICEFFITELYLDQSPSHMASGEVRVRQSLEA